MAVFLSRLWRACGLLVALGQSPISMATTMPVHSPLVQVLHNSFVSVEKFQRLQTFAEQQGVRLQHLNIEKGTLEDLQRAVSEADLVVLDVPRPNDREMVTKRLQQIPQHAETPLLTIGGGRPSWECLSAKYASALVALYTAGGANNFGRFFALAFALQHKGVPPPQLLAAPEHLPATGFYHPKAGRVFSDVDAYLAWYAAYLKTESKGRVAFLIHQGAVADMLTRDVDELIARSEAVGLLPIVFWNDASNPVGLPDALGEAKVDALVNLTHMQDGATRRRDFLALDIPVIQTTRFRDGDATDWPNATSGISARTTAVFLAAPEGWGVMDPLVLSASTNGVNDLLPQQADLLIAKLQSLVALRHMRPADKTLGLMFWNYPAGEKNLAASNLNVPRSIVSMQAALAQEGYQVGAPVTEEQVIAAGQRMLGALYGSVSLDDLEAEGMVARYPLADYQRWLTSLPPQRQKELQEGGEPASHWAVREREGQHYFLIPRWQLGKLAIMPQMPRGLRADAHYHDTASAPDHLYMAAYLYLQNDYAAQALIHLGTHGTQEWLPGKDRGLAATDYPYLAAGSLPVFYPYIQDNMGEAIQAKRRGRAVTISHQTPPFAPAGLYDQLRDLHHLIHEYQQLDEGMVRLQVNKQIGAAAMAAHLHEDLGWTPEQIKGDFDAFLQRLHDHLHELARTAMPLGLHTFGEAASAEHRISTVMQQLGQPFYDALGVADDELFVDDYAALQGTPAYKAVQQMLSTAERSETVPATPQLDKAILQAFEKKAKDQNRRLLDTQENEMLLAGLAGRFIPPGAGGDPIRNPDVQSGRNLYAFEADKIPARAAYESAATAYEQVVQAFRSEHDGAYPQKLAFSLWSSEAIRHLGVTEAQVLHALGLRPVWDSGGRVTALDIIPSAELGRPRVDVVVQVTSVYRDQFDSFMRLLATALDRLSELDEPGNPIAANNQRIAATLQNSGLSAEAARTAASYRIFSNAPGAYGTGVPGLALQSTTWDDDAALARQFLSSSRYAYGSQGWGQSTPDTNLLAEQLRGVQAVIMSRSSNLHGVLSTDHPFEFMGGLSAAIRHLDGASPQLLISDLRSNNVKTTGLAQFLAGELRTRYLNPQWIGAMQQEGYAGTLQVLSATNNLFGWQATDPRMVRDDQWQALFDTYVGDTRQLGTNEWFERHNPTAQAQVLERMAEAIRKGYWDASEETRHALAQRWQKLEQQFNVDTGAAVTRQFIADLAQGFGLDSPSADTADANPTSVPAPAEPMNSSEQGTPAQQVQGQVLEPIAQQQHDHSPQYWVLALMVLLCGGGGIAQVLRNRAVRQVS